jgi:sulfur-oxidizing protein SoxZ
MARTLINVKKTLQRGEAFEIRLLIAHPMESGQRRDAEGKVIPRDIINHFTCTYNGALVVDADFFPAIAANPFLSFWVMAGEAGEVVLSWTDDHGTVQTERVAVTVTA